MKKNNTSIDIIAFGDLTEENLEKLRAFNEEVKSNDGSHLEIVQPGPNLLSDAIIASPILEGDGGAAAAARGGAGGSGGGEGAGAEAFEFGVDPNIDPELALVLRMSAEEEKERQEREKRAREAAEGKTDLEPVPEGKEENQPLLDSAGEPSGSSSSKKQDKKRDGDDDKMGDA
jgi:26S proteasome regulatory subunit N10